MTRLFGSDLHLDPARPGVERHGIGAHAGAGRALQRADAGLGMRAHLGRAGGIAFVDQPFGIEVVHQRGLQRVAQPDQPLVEVRPLHAAQRRRQPRRCEAVGQVQADRLRLVQHQAVVLQHRDQAVGIEREVGRRLVFAPGAIHQHPLERHRQFVQQHVRREAGVAWVVVQADHGVSRTGRRGDDSRYWQARAPP